MRAHLPGLAATAAPTLAFVAAYGADGLRTALVAATVTGVLVLACGLGTRRYLQHAAVGALLAVTCAAVAVGTGQARGFFLLPMLLPAASSAACLLSVLAGRPLAGLVANRVVGGPPRWRSHRPLHRFYRWMTVCIGLVCLASLAAQAALYSRAEITSLGVLHVVMGALWPGITAATLALSRMAVARHRDSAA
ncbi:MULTISPECIES: DUF3159 domain-containing protein [unclassified Streptomyces]|uniref:DUF3159 domain-containing protein n=1 Tax=unclassified Streptomyces TaxID=2593676 RepID=UPI00087FC938|nr:MULTISPECIES: DUF3159 domain-containing protein [unclassified Streptomyces]PBC80585.1 uncharacterized protein DUF3159 [Streptomyces sp. 2321.6]SDR58006.1 Protein of unknown function [Streptomyces sp. KS_16]SEB80617.1 Protein of unknown function [Streptomyces sp. 2133.1]SEF13879.1 Protein of unknown function [Streptomyces sp. 2112.3]SNC61157.1 Protein of unknown function [Streptomyces sp. 2114.4]